MFEIRYVYDLLWINLNISAILISVVDAYYAFEIYFKDCYGIKDR